MLLVIVAVRDSAADAYTVPQFVAHRGVAVRSFRDACNVKDSPLGQHPADYELYQVGVFDDSIGEVTAFGPEMLARGKDMVTEE